MLYRALSNNVHGVLFFAALFSLCATGAQAAFHEWRISEIYSNQSGTVQFIELATSVSGQEFLSGHTITSTQGATPRTFAFPTNLRAGTANKRALIATPAFAALGIVTPDYIMPEGFLFSANGAVNFSDIHTVSYAALPTDGILSINAGGVAAASSPTNYAGVSASISTAPPAVINNFLGANLNGIADFRRNQEYVDVMRQSRHFGSAADPFGSVIAVGADGWPTGDFGVTLMAAQGGVNGIAGVYKGSFMGQATVSSAAAGTVSNLVYATATNTSTFDINFPAGSDTMALRFQSVPAGNPVKNLRVIRPGYSTTNPPVFTSAYLNHVSRFRVLRFMDWLSTNDHANSIVGWADRPTLEKKRTEAEGARWEAVVELANTVNRDIWINIPVRANDEYVTNLATQLRDTLNSGINVYVEYSNELWNGSFAQFAIQRQLAIDEVVANASSPLAYDGSTDQNLWAFRRVAKRLKEISDIFRTVWGASAINTRVRPVLAGQMANNYIVTQGLELVDVGLNVRPNTVFYALSGAPYIYPSSTNDASADETPGLSAAQLLTAIGSGVDNAPNGNSYQYDSHLALGAWYGLKVLAYEGGFDTFGAQNIAAKRQANLDPLIRTHCRNLLNRWHAHGFETFMYFNVGADTFTTQFGQWPLLEDIQDTVHPKNQCMDDVLGAAVPTLTAGVAITSAVPGGAFIDSAAPTGTLSTSSPPFGFPGYAQYLLRVDTAGVYQLRFTSTGSATPKVGVGLNGVTLNPGFVLPESATFTASAPITVTLRKGINALRLSRPADASTWTIQSLSFSLTQSPPGVPTIGSATAGNTQAIIAFSTPASDGGSPITGYTLTCTPGAFSVSGAASPLTVTGLNNGTAYLCSVTATNAIGTSAASASVNVTPGIAPAITSPAGASFTVLCAGAFTFTASGAPTPTFSASGALPSDVTLSNAGVLSGTPAAGSAGSYPLTITASNGVAPDATQNFTLSVVGAAPSVAFQASPATISSGGSATLTWSSNGAICSASGAWSGIKASAGSQVLTNLNATGNYTLTCSGAGGSTSQAVTISVGGG